jgi:hypothetical protein
MAIKNEPESEKQYPVVSPQAAFENQAQFATLLCLKRTACTTSSRLAKSGQWLRTAYFLFAP